jgi:ubiquinone/menaquinone biosynthesis C-methylase UbiE
LSQTDPNLARICGGAGPVRLRIFAWFMARYGHKADRYLALYKTQLFAEVSGTVLEIGPGTGANLRHLQQGKIVHWIGVEPNSFMNRHLAEEARRLRLRIELLCGTAEELPLRAASIDYVISTLVLCSVVDQRRALSELQRVLKPGGKLIFIEHVAAPAGTWLRRIQSALEPLWRRMGDGCHPDRETLAAIERSGLTVAHVEEFTAPLPVVRPHIAGYAIKPIPPA